MTPQSSVAVLRGLQPLAPASHEPLPLKTASAANAASASFGRPRPYHRSPGPTARRRGTATVADHRPSTTPPPIHSPRPPRRSRSCRRRETARAGGSRCAPRCSGRRPPKVSCSRAQPHNAVRRTCCGDRGRPTGSARAARWHKVRSDARAVAKPRRSTDRARTSSPVRRSGVTRVLV